MEWKKILRKGYVAPSIDRTTTLPDAVAAITHAVAAHLLESPHVRAYLVDLPKGEGTFCPSSPIEELVKEAATQTGNVDKRDPLVTLGLIRQLIVPVVSFERAQVLRILGAIDDITPSERMLFRLSLKLSEAHDRLWARWFREIIKPYQYLDASGKERYETITQTLLARYDYTVFEYKPDVGCVNRRSWAAAFPKEIGVIARLLFQLERCAPEPTIADYFAELLNAYACVAVDQLETVWKNVDLAWIKIPQECRIIPVHGMESGYEHPFCVSPEFRLEVRTQESRPLITEARRGTICYAEMIGLRKSLIDVLVQKLERIDISVFSNAIRSGSRLNFRAMGQAVPNRQEVLAEGGKIFLDGGAPVRTANAYRGHMQKHCAPETTHALQSFITPLGMLTHTIHHEYAHPVGRTQTSDAAIGAGIKLLEEGKATLLGILAHEHQHRGREERLECIAITVARILRFMYTTELENSTIATYVRENLAAATTLFDAGVMTLSSSGIVIDLKKAASAVWFEKLKEFNVAVIAAYQASDVDALQRLTHLYCDMSSEPLRGLISWVNRN